MWYVLIAVGIIACAILAISAKRLLISAIWLALSSALVALMLFLLGAPQIAVIELSRWRWTGHCFVCVCHQYCWRRSDRAAFRAAFAFSLDEHHPGWWFDHFLYLPLTGICSIPSRDQWNHCQCLVAG